MKKYTSGLIWSQILLQTIISLFPVIASHSVAAQPHSLISANEQNTRQGTDTGPVSPFSVDRNDLSTQQTTTLPYSSTMAQGAQMLVSGHASDSARSLAVGTASGEIQQWLSQFGTARIQLDMDRHGNWSHSSGELLVPVYDDQRSLLFVQGGIRKPSDRLTGNLGTGIRHFWPNGWMTGGNIFFDEDFSGHHRRIGIGGETWRDYLRLSANTYFSITNWRTSRDFEGQWQEKPANGYDIRLQTWLPAHPQLGGKLSWEQYYGNQVALSGRDHLQRNPYSVTAGLEYTPFPLITLGAERKQSRGSYDTRMSLGLRWHFNNSWNWHKDPSNVQYMRTLAGGRYDLVERNNEVVLRYRKTPEQGVEKLEITIETDNSPADGVARNVLQVLAINHDGQPARHVPVNWSIPSDDTVSLIVPSAVTDENGISIATLSSTKIQTVPVTAQSGGVSVLQNSHFMAVAASHIELEFTKDNAVADGIDTNKVVATLTDSNGRPVAGQKVIWKVAEGITPGDSSSESDASGRAIAHFSSKASGNVAVYIMSGNLTANGTMHFTGNTASARISALSVTADGSPADGKTANVAQVTVADANGNTLPGQAVVWSADKTTVIFGQSEVTDPNGKTSVNYTDTVAEALNLTATLANGNSHTTESIFISNQNTARLKDMNVTSGAKANGSDTNIATVTVTDANGNALTNMGVTFSVTGNAKLNSTKVNTDGNGEARVTLTDSTAETVQVTARLGTTGSSMTQDCRFVVDLERAQLAITATSGALADGSTTVTVTVSLNDLNNHPVPGQAVTVTATGNAALSATSGSTDNHGQFIVTLTDTVAETVNLTASLDNGMQASAQSAFIDFSVTTLTTSSSSVKADGTDSVTLTATVKDAEGRPVTNTPVIFSATGNAILSETTVITGSYGLAQVTMTDVTDEEVIVTAKAQKSSSDKGKTVSVSFVGSRITGLFVNEARTLFTAESGFPETGFSGASFTLNIDGDTQQNKDYTWSSNQGWVTVSDGVATFTGTPASGTKSVIITASAKNGHSPLTWSFTLKHWFTFSPDTMKSAAADSYCQDLKQSVPSKDLLDYTDRGTAKVGSLWSEWLNSLPRTNYDAVWAAETGRYSRYYMFLYDGHVYDNAGSHSFGAVCVTHL